MSTEAALLSLSGTISGLQTQIDDLKQDKQDLRSDKESLKGEVGNLREQLRIALAEVSRLGEELEKATSAVGELQKLCEAARDEREARDQVSRQPASVQTDSTADATPIVVDFVPEDPPLTPSPTPCPVVDASPPVQDANDDSAGPPASRTRKRKAAAIAEASERVGVSQKRPNVSTTHNLRSHRRGAGAGEPETQASTSTSVLTRGRPVVPYNEDVAFVLPPHILQHYLELAPPLAISPAPSELHVNREFLADIYGGSPKQSAQHIGAFENPSEDCHRAFTFPRYDLNPDMPLIPGQGGVIIASRYDRKTGHPWGLFRKDISGTTQTWLYLGEYKWIAMGTMSAETFRRQKQKVKENWADELLGWRRGLGYYYPAMRARIALRKAGMLPAPDISDHHRLVREELERIKSRNGNPVDKDDIIAAFECGEEALDLTLLRCVSYDRILAMDIEEKFGSPPARTKRTTKRIYNYPTEFKSSLTRGRKHTSKGMPPSAPPQPPPEPSAPATLTGTGADLESSYHPPNSASSDATVTVDGPLLRQGMSGVYSVILGEENMDDGLSYVSEDEPDELSYP